MRLALVCLLAGCTGYEDVVGPFTGETRRFVVDAIDIPTTNTKVRGYAGHLNTDSTADNALGGAISTLAGVGNVTTHGHDMIAAGALASSVLIVADDFENDPSVSLLYLGTEDAGGTPLGGSFVDGTFMSNRTSRTRLETSATIVLPVFADADPTVLPLIGVQAELVPDSDGGYVALVQGVVPQDAVFDAAYRGIRQMVEARPSAHIGMLSFFDVSPRDWQLSYNEVAQNSIVVSLLASDMAIRGTPGISLGFRVHLTPCERERCQIDAVWDHCFDRMLNGDETGVDCGGSCGPCVTGVQCKVAGDCETLACDGGTCGPPSCTNGVRDGFEVDVDCGGAYSKCPSRCAAGRRCWSDDDCVGRCHEPCMQGPDDIFPCFSPLSYSTCE